jgi:scyllo-inositol 2-dehydrogenase (NADP+)
VSLGEAGGDRLLGRDAGRHARGERAARFDIAAGSPYTGLVMTTLRVGLAGFGASARTFHLPLLAALPGDFTVAAVLERQARDAPALLPAATVHTSLDAFVADPGVDVAIICLPNELHADVAVALLAAGKHVVVEKPMAITAADCERMIAAARAADRQLFVFHSRRLDGDLAGVRATLASGALGRLVRAEIRYDRWANALRKKAWKEEGREGSTLLDDLGSHLLDQALTLFGAPTALSCRLGIQRDGSHTVDAYRISLTYPGGLWVDLESSMVVRHGPFHWALHGTEGTLLKSGLDPQEAQLQQGLSPLDPGFGREDEAQAAWLHPRDGSPRRLPTPPGRYLAFYENVAAALAGRAPSQFTAEQGLAVVRLLEACRRSAATGEEVAL